MALINCPKCGASISEQASVCPQCKETVSKADSIICEECKTKYSSDLASCPQCGHRHRIIIKRNRKNHAKLWRLFY